MGRYSTVAAVAKSLLADGVAELTDLDGELRVRVFGTPTPGLDTSPVLELRGEPR